MVYNTCISIKYIEPSKYIVSIIIIIIIDCVYSLHVL